VSTVDVGERPVAIAIDEDDDIAYVANAGSITVTVINVTDHSNIANVTGVSGPIAIDEVDDIAYVLNTFDVSIIYGDTLKVSTVDVGYPTPSDIAIDGDDDIAYVLNGDTVSVLYDFSQQAQAGVSFDVNPFYAESIECNNITVPTNQYFYVDFRTQCTAQANQGFQFGSWIENLGSNSSRTISASQGDWFTNTLASLSEEDKEKELNEIKDNIEESYAKGKISEQHYNLLNKKIESFMNTNKNKLEGANKTHITKRSPI
jgi:DNA-binding beta-propeller fold protein YncE